MNGDLLIVYATRYGSTREAAGLLKDVLAKAGFGTDLRRARDVRTLEGVGAVVLAAPFYIGRLHRDAEAFLNTHREALAARPTAIAAFGPLGAGKAEDRDQLEATLGRHPGLKPVSAGMFGGVYDPAKLRGLDRLLAALPASPLHGLAARDDLDRTGLRLWAEELAGLLRG